MTRLVIDPVTRVGGQLRLEAQLEAGSVRDAWLSVTNKSTPASMKILISAPRSCSAFLK